MLAIVTVLVIYRIGPVMDTAPADSKLPLVKYDITSVESYVKNFEAEFKIKKDNEARIIWGDSAKKKTEYVLLYIHGFSASWYEGYPTNVNFANAFKCNAYFARLDQHGLDTEDALLHMEPKGLYDSAKEALLVAKTLGDKVIIMSTSTGGTLSLMLAADYPDLVDGLVMYSPNIEMRQKATKLLPEPWGLQLGSISEGGKMRHLTGSALEDEYWYLNYRLEGVVYLQQLVNQRMNKATYSKVKCPVFLAYYYKDEDHQDDVVSVEAMMTMYDQLGSDKKVKTAFPDAGRHTIAFIEAASPQKVSDATIAFATEYLGMETAQ